MLSIAVFSPAKINLFLAVTGRRADGFHDLVSLVAPISFGDTLGLRAGDSDGPVTLSCDDPAVPTGMDNLAVRAAEAWRCEAGFARAIHIALKKRIPMGAGLGGGSSNATAVLRGLNSLAGHPLDDGTLARLAAGLGSDCPLFLAGAPCVMRGRGERLEPLPDRARRRLTGRRLLVIKPDFPISTPWAYGRLVAAGGAAYTPAGAAEARLAAWCAGEAPASEVLFNSFEQVAFTKFQAMPVLLERLRAQPCADGVLMSGSGSACFALLKHGADAASLRELVRAAWGAGAVLVEAEIQ
jgi:4-diphosphocytidyl-2-C-methyl-D-erythritol kinase